MSTDGFEEMCPNCVTPWKCNGPHEFPPAAPEPTNVAGRWDDEGRKFIPGIAVTHTRSSTDAGPDYCDECSAAMGDWVQWPCAAFEPEAPTLDEATAGWPVWWGGEWWASDGLLLYRLADVMPLAQEGAWQGPKQTLAVMPGAVPAAVPSPEPPLGPVVDVRSHAGQIDPMPDPYAACKNCAHTQGEHRVPALIDNRECKHIKCPCERYMPVAPPAPSLSQEPGPARCATCDHRLYPCTAPHGCGGWHHTPQGFDPHGHFPSPAASQEPGETR